MRGYTLVELIVVIALLGAIAAVAVPSYKNAQRTNDTSSVATTLATTLRRAQFLSQSIDGDTSWGVRAASGTITLFRGTSYASRTVSYDETYTVPASVTPTGQTDTVFAPFTGIPNATGTITLTGASGSVKTLSINAKGIITIQ